MGFDQSDLLNAAGYASGDFVPLVTDGRGSQKTLSTTSTTYDDESEYNELFVDIGNIIPPSSTAMGFINCFVATGSGETVDVRLRETVGNVTVAEETGITSNDFYLIGPEEFEPNYSASRSVFRAQAKTNPGSNQVDLTAITTGIGIQL